MAEKKKSSRGRGPKRHTKADWIKIALDTLISEGEENVKVLVLSAKMDTSRSSFYWHFDSRADLLDDLLEHWRSTNTQVIAVRDWARRSGSVRALLDKSDNQRLDALTDMFRRYGYADGESEVRARILYFTQIGYDALDQKEDWDTRISRAAHYLYCLSGKEPADADVESLNQVRATT